MATPPDGRQPGRSAGRRDPSRPAGASLDGADEARLAPGEQARVDEAVVRVSRGGRRGPALVATLVAVAFLLGLVRPWDWLVGAGSSGSGTGDAAGATAPTGMVGTGQGGTGPSGSPPSGPVQAATCGYPSSWRTAAISFWAGARARIWTAAVAVPATGPDDPSIPFHPIASDRVEAIGWCAPVSGPERPPLVAEATLFRLVDGVVTEVRADRLEPAGPDALGELWVPPAQGGVRRAEWAPGRYVIRLAVASGRYARYLGLEVGLTGAPTATAGPGSTAAPGPTAGPGPSAEAVEGAKAGPSGSFSAP